MGGHHVSPGYFTRNCFREEKLTCQRCALQNLHLSHVRAVFPLQFRAFSSRLRPLFFIAFVFFLHHGNFFSRVVHDRAIFLVIYHQPQIPFQSDVGTSCITFKYPGSSFSVPPLGRPPSSWDLRRKSRAKFSPFFYRVILMIAKSVVVSVGTQHQQSLPARTSLLLLCRVSIHYYFNSKKKYPFWAGGSSKKIVSFRVF